MVINNSTNLYSNSRYIVGAGSPYTTIQAAINAALAAGGNACVWVRSGTYTENLTLYDTIDIEGADNNLTIIVGTHTPPTSGAFSFVRCGLSSTTHILSSAAAGTTTIGFSRCKFMCTNGYAAYLTNWTGQVNFRYCIDSSTINGVFYNTTTAPCTIEFCDIGKGTANALTASGNVKIYATDLFAPISLGGSGVSQVQGGAIVHGNITTAATHTLTIGISGISSGAVQAITHNSASTLAFNNVVVNSSNSPSIGGTGTVELNSVSFPGDYDLAGTITNDLTGTMRTEQILAENIVAMKDSGFESWAAAGPYFDDTTLGTFDLLVGGVGYIKNERITWVAQTITGLTAGSTWYIYIDSTGTIGKSASRTDALFENNIVLFECMRDSTLVNNQVTVAENHPYNVQTALSNYLHNTAGIVIENGQNGANITLNGTQGIQINGADVLNDHGLVTTISDSGGAAVTWLRYFTNAGGKWARQNATTTFTGYWNNAGTATALTANRFAVYRLYVSKSSLNAATPTYFAVLHTAQFTTSGAANTAISNGTIAGVTNELAALELAQLGYIIYSEATASITSVIISKSTLRSSTSTAGTNTAALVNTTTTNFDAWLSAADTNVQAALESIDDLGKGNLLVSRAGVGTDVTLTVSNTDNSAAASAAHQQISVGGSTSTGDPYTNYLVTGAGTFSVGIDNSDSDKLKITTGASPSAGTDLLSITSAGDVTVTAGILRTERSYNAGLVYAQVNNLDNGSTSSSAAFGVNVAGTSAGDPYYAANITGGQGWSWGLKNTVSDKFYLCPDVGLASSPVLISTTAGEITKPLQPAFLAYQASVASDVTGAGGSYTLGTTVDLTEVYDQNSDFDPASGVFTAPVTGRYLLGAQVRIDELTAAMDSGLFAIVASSRQSNYYFGNVGGMRDAQYNIFTLQYSTAMDMTAGDTATFVITVYRGAGNNADIFGNASLATACWGFLTC